ncbi:hypothetical protein BH10ACI2_BH10ACI2_00040 [soil metagenome]
MSLSRMGTIGRYSFLIVVSALSILHIQSQWCDAQCLLIDKNRGSLFISYEKQTVIKNEGGGTRKGILLKLHNNSNCSVIVTTGSYEAFVKPLPENPTFLQRTHPEIKQDLPDGIFVPEVQYAYFTPSGRVHSLRGDSFFEFNLLGRRSMLFEVPLSDFELAIDSKISLLFQYAWEYEKRAKHYYPSVENTVHFSLRDLPDETKLNVNKK